MVIRLERDRELGLTLDIIIGKIIVSITPASWSLDVKHWREYVGIGCVTIGKY